MKFKFARRRRGSFKLVHLLLQRSIRQAKLAVPAPRLARPLPRRRSVGEMSGAEQSACGHCESSFSEAVFVAILLRRCFRALRANAAEKRARAPPPKKTSTVARDMGGILGGGGAAALGARAYSVSGAGACAGAGARAATDKPGRVGLVNLGNTCYLNSILQALAHVHSFRDVAMNIQPVSYASSSGGAADARPSAMLLSADDANRASRDGHELIQISRDAAGPPVVVALRSAPQLLRQSTAQAHDDLELARLDSAGSKRSRRDDGSSDGFVEAWTPESSLALAVSRAVRCLWSGTWSRVSPYGLVRAVGRAMPQFKGTYQQDAEEFLLALLNALHEELASGGSAARGPVLAVIAPDFAPTKQRSVWPLGGRAERGCTTVNTVDELLPHLVSTTAVGKLFGGATVTSTKCKGCQNTCIVSAPFSVLTVAFPSGNTAPSLSDCFAEFSATESLEGDDAYDCERCRSKGKQKAERSMQLETVPDVLALHVKRYSFSREGVATKILTHLDFPLLLTAADMAPFCVSARKCAEGSWILRSVVEHRGERHGSGHYTAACATSDGWYMFDDARATKIESPKHLSAYILLYERLSNGSP